MGQAEPEEEQHPQTALEHFAKLLQPVLPSKEEFELIHIHSLPQRCRKLVFTSTHDKRLDVVSTHFFVLVHRTVAVLALEIFMFESIDKCTFFISKADTTGFYCGPGRLNVLQIIQQLLRGTLRFYNRATKLTRICLFAKSEKQYLFLGSIKNQQKHVLPDAELVKWWVMCIDGLYDLFTSEVKCALAVPGLTDLATARYFPSNPAFKWYAGDIFWDSTKETEEAALAVRRIPRFPDDPKSRFLDSLVTEKRAKKVSCRLFWLELQSRQEFRSGKSVGLIGLEGMLNQSELQDFARENNTSKRDTNRFKDLLISLSFDSFETTEQSTRRLLSRVPDNAKVPIVGTAAHKRTVTQATDPVVNTLGITMVRRKKPKVE